MSQTPTDRLNRTTFTCATSADLKRTRGTTGLRYGVMSLSLLPLAGCGGGGGSTASPTTPVTPDPDFVENPANIFTASSDNDSILSEGSATADLTVIGKGGDDNITTGSGDDMIRGGEGADRISAGDGDDVIVVIGTTSANQYTSAAITNPAGSGIDLSSLITLAELNGRTVSEVEAGEIIDGDAGNNTLYIYGTVDLTGVTLTGLNQLIVNSDVTLTQAQLAQFTTVDGDGNSVINVVVPDGQSAILDLSLIDISNIGNLNIDGNLTIVVSDLDDLEGVNTVSAGSGSHISLEVSGNGSPQNLDLNSVGDVFETLDAIDLGPDVTLAITETGVLTALGLAEISGVGVIDAGNSQEVVEALRQIDTGETEVAPLVLEGSEGNDTLTGMAGDDTLQGLGGNDTLTGGDGNDLIRGGTGADSINGGDGDDIIVLVGTTSASQYTSAAITNPAGSDVDLSSLISLSDLNGQIVSEAKAGETIDGGTGNNRLFVYGTVDLTEVTLTNVNQLIVNSEVTLTSQQFFSLRNIIGDGNSILNVVPINGESSIIIDLSRTSISGIDTLNAYNNVLLQIDDISDLEGVSLIKPQGADSIDIEIKETEVEVEISLSQIASVVTSVGIIHISGNTTLVIDDVTLVETLGLTHIAGIHDGGKVEIADTEEAYNALASIFVDPRVAPGFTLTGGNGDDELNGLEGPDTIYGNDGNDTLDGHQGDDHIEGGTGDDLLHGGTWGNDTLLGGTGSDTLDGGRYNDILIGGEGDDVILGGWGYDRLVYSGQSGDYSISMDSDGTITITDNNTLDGNDGTDTIYDIEIIKFSDTELAPDSYTLFLDGNDISVVNTNDIIARPAVEIAGENIEFTNDGVSLSTLDTAPGSRHSYSPTAIFVSDEASGTIVINNLENSEISNSSSGPGIFALHATIIENSGTISGTYGIGLYSGGTITNHSSGEITGTNGGISAANTPTTIINEGVISTAFGAAIHLVDTHPLTVINSGTITGDIGIAEGGGHDDVITNSSIINGNIFLNARNDEVTNSGLIDGNVELGIDDDIYDGSNGAVTGIVFGGDGNDLISGGNSNDSLSGDGGDDLISGGAGADIIDGGTGTDTASYSSSTSAVVVSLDGSAGSQGDAEGDSLTSIENLIGSAFGDVLKGNDDDNILQGLEGDDYFSSSAGADTLDGGLGQDSARYQFSDAAVFIDLGAGTASGGHAEGDILISIENLWGSDFDDTLTGDMKDNRLYGHDGDDTLLGAEGNDYLEGMAGADHLDGGDGIDEAVYVNYNAEGVTVNLTTGMGSGGNAEGDTFISIENVTGTQFDDIITGNADNNSIQGSSGNDTLYGDDGNDWIWGGVGNDIIYGGDGDDNLLDSFGTNILYGGGGADRFSTGSGDDTIVISNLDFVEISTWEGNDTLVLDGSELNLDLGSPTGDLISGIEEIDLTGSGDNSLTLALSDLLDLSSTSDQLIVMGDSGDSVTSTGQNWVQQADQDIDGETYHVYTSGMATLLVDEDINQTIS